MELRDIRWSFVQLQRSIWFHPKRAFEPTRIQSIGFKIPHKRLVKISVGFVVAVAIQLSLFLGIRIPHRFNVYLPVGIAITFIDRRLGRRCSQTVFAQSR